MAVMAASLELSTLQIDDDPFKALEESLNVLLYKLKGIRRDYALSINDLYCFVFCGKFVFCFTAFSEEPTLSLSIDFEGAKLHSLTAYWSTLGTNGR